jgi:hypothetical protein
VIDTPHTGETTVNVRDLAVGATLDIYVEDKLANALLVERDTMPVSVTALIAGAGSCEVRSPAVIDCRSKFGIYASCL